MHKPAREDRTATDISIVRTTFPLCSIFFSPIHVKMAFVIDKITKDNYPLFDDMAFWRENGVEREPENASVSTKIVMEK